MTIPATRTAAPEKAATTGMICMSPVLRLYMENTALITVQIAQTKAHASVFIQLPPYAAL
jgi:hypothetical protein